MSAGSQKKRHVNESKFDGDTNPPKRRKLSQNSTDRLSQTASNNKTISHKTESQQSDQAQQQNNTSIDFELNEDFDDFDENNGFEDGDENGDDDWGELNYDQQPQIKLFNINELTESEKYKLKKEKRRKLNSNKDRFWKCGKCSFLNHPSQAQCFSCKMPEIDIIRYLLNCLEPLKQCSKCNAYIIPKSFEDHLLDCDPLIATHKQTPNNVKHNWHCELAKIEKNAVCYVTNQAFTKSEKKGESEKLLHTIKGINQENNLIFGEENKENEICDKLLTFLEWTVPITIRVHCARLIPKLLKDTHYRNLFETGYGSGNVDQQIRKREEMKMFGEVYFGADPNERPKYGCLNINLKPEGCTLAHQYGDGYFVMNDTTVRWRVTLTIKDSFAVNGDCATLKNCTHLLNQLAKDELTEMMRVAVFGKNESVENDEDSKQKAYREIQIHGPVLLNRDICSFHVPDNAKNRQFEDRFKLFCDRNDIKLVWF